MRRLRLGLNLLRSKITAKKIPIQLNIHITDVCNLRCRYCYIDFNHAHDDMPLLSLLEILRQARRLGTERISLEGGEPLLRKDIGGIVNFITDLGMECNINTNGFLFAERINDIGRVDMISVSLDGERQANDSMRGRGSFDKAVAAIKMAKERGIKVQVLSVLNKESRHSVDFMINLAKELGFTWVPTSPFFVAGRQIGEQEAAGYAINDTGYRELLDELSEKKAQGAPIAWSFQTLRYVKNWPCSYVRSNFLKLSDDKNITNGFKPVNCQAGRYFCVIQTNGDIYPCDPLLGHKKTANCFKAGLEAAFNQLDTADCMACNSLVCTEYNFLFSLNPAVIFNQLSSYGKSGVYNRRRHG